MQMNAFSKHSRTNIGNCIKSSQKKLGQDNPALLKNELKVGAMSLRLPDGKRGGKMASEFQRENKIYRDWYFLNC